MKNIIIGSLYKISNKINNKNYIGVTKRDPNERWNEHKHYAIKKNCKYILHRAIRKYGIENFKFEIILQSKDFDYLLKEAEINFIQEYKSHVSQNGYNM